MVSDFSDVPSPAMSAYYVPIIPAPAGDVPPEWFQGIAASIANYVSDTDRRLTEIEKKQAVHDQIATECVNTVNKLKADHKTLVERVTHIESINRQTAEVKCLATLMFNPHMFDPISEELDNPYQMQPSLPLASNFKDITFETLFCDETLDPITASEIAYVQNMKEQAL